ncbi:hypothetical protein GCM10010129_82780 [Streptomyces fumigatiscleroticus]|nr:hypothetical protein GCM10010129_82780 [Streptomyces fumigatiscleroticus]
MCAAETAGRTPPTHPGRTRATPDGMHTDHDRNRHADDAAVLTHPPARASTRTKEYGPASDSRFPTVTPQPLERNSHPQAVPSEGLLSGNVQERTAGCGCRADLL